MKEINIPPIFKAMAETIEPYFLTFTIDIKQSRMNTTLKEYLAKICYQSLNIGVMFTLTLVMLAIFSGSMKIIGMALLVGPILTGFIFYNLLYTPRIKLQKKAKLIDKNLPFALRHLLIELKSGIPLYQAIVAISRDYDEMSNEVNEIVKEINSGKSEVKAIGESVDMSPSLNYRKAFWQILNSLKTGTDITKSLDSTVDNIMKKQLISIKQYGQELNPWTLMYMMTGVIAPSLGLTFLMLISTFTGLTIPEWGMYAILFFLAGFQLFFLNEVKIRRPMIRI